MRRVTLVLASCGEGSTAVVCEKDGKTFESLGRVETAKGGRTCTLDPGTHKLYVAAGVKGGAVKIVVLAPEGTR